MKGHFVVALIYTVYSNSKAFVCTKQLSFKLCESKKTTVALNYIVYSHSNYLNNFEQAFTLISPFKLQKKNSN